MDANGGTPIDFAPNLFKGQVALINGGTSGMGYRTAEIMLRSGLCGLAIVARTEADGQAVREKLGKLRPDAKIEFIRADYLVSDDVERIFRIVDERFGRLDIFVHTMMTNAGPRPFSKTNHLYWHKVTNTLFLSFVECAAAAVPLMRRGGGGAIVSIASDAMRVATPGEAVIGGAMAANVMFAKGLALEEGRSGIRVNVVTPTITRDTRAYASAMAGGFSRELFSKAESRARLGLADARDVAWTVAFLASRLSSKTTGQVVSVNGGVSII